MGTATRKPWLAEAALSRPHPEKTSRAARRNRGRGLPADDRRAPLLAAPFVVFWWPRGAGAAPAA
eukprot:5539427-Lingulodinium_polyedra.AAC.1